MIERMHETGAPYSFSNMPAPLSALEEPIDLRSVFARFLLRLPIFLTVALVILGAVAAYTFTARPTYTAAASLLITPRGTDLLKDQEQTTQPTDTTEVDTQVQVLNSRALARRVAQKLQLQNDPEFNPALRPKKTDVLSGLMSAIEASRTVPILGPDHAVETAANSVLAHTKARRSGLTYVIDVAFTARSGDKAAKIANAIADQYINASVEAKYSTVHGANEFINDRLNSLAQEVQANDAALQQYKIAHNLISAQGATSAEEEMSSLNQQIAGARADLAEHQARLTTARNQIAKGGGGADVSAALGSSVVASLRAQRGELVKEQADLETRYGPLHPEVKKVEEELTQNNIQIKQEIDRIISNLQAEVDVAQQRLNSLQGSLGSAQGSLASNNQALVGLDELQRKADASRAVYEAFLNRSKEATAQEGLQQADARVTSPAQAPERPTAPNKPLNFALGFVLALAGGTGAALLVENLDSALLTSRDVEKKLQMPCIGAVPLIKHKSEAAKDAYIVQKPFSAFAESFRNLKTALTVSAEQRDVQVIMITSALPGEGKTLTTLSFGRGIAQGGAKVLLIDADMRRAALTNAVKKQPALGIEEVLIGKATLKDAVVKDEMSGADLLLLTERAVSIDELLSSEAFDRLLQQARAFYDFILIDTAPVLAVAETRAVAVKADATVFLVRWSKTPKQAAGDALDLLIASGAFVAGVCLTQVDLTKQTRLGYGDKLYYYKSYRKYYAD